MSVAVALLSLQVDPKVSKYAESSDNKSYKSCQ